MSYLGAVGSGSPERVVTFPVIGFPRICMALLSGIPSKFYIRRTFATVKSIQMDVISHESLGMNQKWLTTVTNSILVRYSHSTRSL